MKKKKTGAKSSSLVAGVLGLILLVGIGFWWKNSLVPVEKTQPISTISSSAEQDNSSSPNSQSVSSLDQRKNYDGYGFTVAGWIPDWATDSGLESLKNNIGKIQNISPVWFEAQKDGTLKNNTPKKSTEIISLARKNNIEITPSIASFDHEVLTPFLQDPTKLDLHVKSIVDMVVKNNYDGVDLDYESTKLSDKEQFFSMLEKLSKQLRDNKKKLYFAVLPKWDDAIVYASLKETRQVQDWARMAPLVDCLRIMAYDYTSSLSQNPGPIAPLDWVESVIKYALTKADKSKFSLGTHLYGYERWVEVKDKAQDQKFDDSRLRFVTDFRQDQSKVAMRSYTYDTIQTILKSNKGTTEEYQGEKIFRYSKVNNTTKILENRVLVYIDQSGIQARTDLAKKYGLAGQAFWRLGGDQGLI